MSEPILYVLAGTYQQAHDAMAGRHPRSWRYVMSPRDLFGIQGGIYRTVGTFWERRDAHELLDRAHASGLISESEERDET